MGLDIVESCPLIETIELVDLIKTKFKDQTLLIDIIKIITQSLKVIIKEINKTTHTGESIGTTAGTVIHMFIQPKQFRLKRNAHINSNTLVILKGILKGLGENDSSTFCHEAVIEHSPEVIQVIQDFIKNIKEGNNFHDSLQKALMQFFTIIDITKNCRLFELISTLKNIITTEGFKQFGKRLQDNIPNFMIIAKKMIAALIAKDENEIGINIGQAIKIICDFYVN